ncbi:hypothetical protein ACH4TQ_27345 [Streptomyces sp. NPDC021218]|uniref:hypothetical protein n=1 Tax=Streptomyces sp. NPDC021218 TaxID=3365119 RepID=UPI0037A6FF83
MTVQEALIRLRQYQERPAPTWSTASYGGGSAESALAEIGRTLAAEVDRLRAPRDARDAELLAEVVSWLLKKAGEYQATGTRQHEANALSTMASKIARGAVRLFLDEAGKVTPTGAGITQPAELTIYRASHDSIVMGLYTTREAAREHCEAEERSSWPGRTGITFAWIPDDSDPLSPEELSVFAGQNDESATGYVVTPLTVASEYDEEADE